DQPSGATTSSNRARIASAAGAAATLADVRAGESARSTHVLGERGNAAAKRAQVGRSIVAMLSASPARPTRHCPRCAGPVWACCKVVACTEPEQLDAARHLP